MTDVLGLFCGGPALYGTGVPKPLMPVAGRTLLHWYLDRTPLDRFDSVTLLVDDAYADQFATDVSAITSTRIEVVTSMAGASTLERAAQLLDLLGEQDRVRLTYPDVFTTADLEPFDQQFPVHMSVTALTSRFPRVFLDAYTRQVRGISNHTSPVPANPVHIFGGHVIGIAGKLAELLTDFSHDAGSGVSLEVDFFGWLINRGKVGAIPIFDDWFQVDSPRDVTRLEELLTR